MCITNRRNVLVINLEVLLFLLLLVLNHLAKCFLFLGFEHASTKQ